MIGSGWHPRGSSLHGSVSRGALTLASTNVALVPAVERSAEQTPEVRFQSVLLPLALPPAEDAANSLRALPYALGLLPPGGTLHLLHTVTDRPLTPELRDARLAELRAVAERSVRARAIKLEFHVVPAADASAALVQAAAELRVDALCLPLPRPSSPGAAQDLLGATLSARLSGCRCQSCSSRLRASERGRAIAPSPERKGGRALALGPAQRGETLAMLRTSSARARPDGAGLALKTKQ